MTYKQPLALRVPIHSEPGADEASVDEQPAHRLEAPPASHRQVPAQKAGTRWLLAIAWMGFVPASFMAGRYIERKQPARTEPAGAALAAPLPAAEAPLVLTQTVARSELRPLALRGTVVAGSRLHLAFKLPGVLKQLLVREGDAVQKDQVLARLDATNAEAQVQVAQAALDKAQRDSDSMQTLSADHVVPQNQRDDARSGLDVARAQLAMAKEALARMQLSSPVAGRVYQHLAEAGEAVGAGSPILFVDETERLLIKVGVTDHELQQLVPNQPVTLRLAGQPDPLPGVIYSIAPSPSAQDGLYSVQISTTANTKTLWPGLLVTVVFDHVKTLPTLRIPLQALVNRQNRDLVFVIDHNIARLRPITIGASEQRQTIVLSGLREGELIITEGAAFLEDGQLVRPLAEEAP